MRAVAAGRAAGQETEFLKGEGDRYYQRNREELLRRERSRQDLGLELLRRHRLVPRRVLDVGCSNGWRCELLRRRYGSDVVGVEPSRRAIREGRTLYPDVTFRHGTVDRLPVGPDEVFDLVIISFVLHWVSRDRLLRAVAEIDRCVAEDGHVLLADFWPRRPVRVPYHHLPAEGMYTYKADYPQVFSSSGLYRGVGRIVFNTDTRQRQARPPAESRGLFSLMRKSTEAFYELGRLRARTGRG